MRSTSEYLQAAQIRPHKRFRLVVEGPLIDGGTAGEARDFISDLETSCSAAHLFQRGFVDRPAKDDQRNGHDVRLASMSPLQRLQMANAELAARRAREDVFD